ncbi:putative holin-like toxin [Paenibacillus sp. FSL R5-0810]
MPMEVKNAFSLMFMFGMFILALLNAFIGFVEYFLYKVCNVDCSNFT